MVHRHNKVEEVLNNYFEDLFTTSSLTLLDEVCSKVQNRIIDNMKIYFAMEFFGDEVRLAIKQMHLDKAPRPDDLPALFYWRFWHEVGSDVTRAVLDILNNKGGNKFQ